MVFFCDLRKQTGEFLRSFSSKTFNPLSNALHCFWSHVEQTLRNTSNRVTGLPQGNPCEVGPCVNSALGGTTQAHQISHTMCKTRSCNLTSKLTGFAEGVI